MRVLIAHSDAAVRGLLAQTLSGRGLQVEVAERLDQVNELVAAREVDLALLEVGEAGEGIDVCGRLKRELDRFVPVVLLLSRDAAEARQQALRAGADECLDVPVDVDELMARVRSFLRIKSLQDELHAVDRLRQELVEAVSHDLRSPLVGIIGAVQNMLGGYAGATTPQQREYLMMIGRTASRFHERMERIQRLARLEVRRGAVRVENVDLEEQTRRAAAPLGQRLNEKLVRLDIRVLGGPPPVRGEASLVREALGHLLDNALKYSPPSATIRVTIDEVVENESFYVRWSVRDEGMGIRRSDQERIFHRFEQVADAQDPAEAPGTGLGLAVAKEIVESHGGRVEVRSDLGKGATFVLLLPAAGERVRA
jgi:signal transduction histidine kinase